METVPTVFFLFFNAGCRDVAEADDLFRRFSKPNSKTMKL
jgi:hypothetical protein